MSLELLDRVFRNWDDPNYTGFKEMLFVYGKSEYAPSKRYHISFRAQMDSENGNYLTLSSKKISECDSTRESLFEYYDGYNIQAIVYTPGVKKPVYRMRNFPTPRPIIELWNKYLRTDFKYILEIGFAGGFATLNAMDNTNAKMMTLDKFYYQHYWYSKNYIDEKYPGRHSLIASKMKYPTQYLDKYCPDIKFDLISFNKSKKYESVYKYFVSFKKYAHKDTIILVSDPTPNQVWGIGTYMAMNKAISDGIVTLVEYVKLDDVGYFTGAILKYNFEPEYIQKLPIKLYISMEEKIPNVILLNLLKQDYEEGVGKIDIKMINKYVVIFEKYGLKFSDEILKILKLNFNIIPTI